MTMDQVTCLERGPYCRSYQHVYRRELRYRLVAVNPAQIHLPSCSPSTSTCLSSSQKLQRFSSATGTVASTSGRPKGMRPPWPEGLNLRTLIFEPRWTTEKPPRVFVASHILIKGVGKVSFCLGPPFLYCLGKLGRIQTFMMRYSLLPV